MTPPHFCIFVIISPLKRTWPLICTILNLHYIRKLSCKMTYSGSVVLEKKIFKRPHPILAFLRLSPLWRGPGRLFEQFRIPFTQGWFMPSLIKIGMLVLEKKIFFNINICKYSFPCCGPSWPPGTMMWTILNLHHIRKLSCKYDVFWLSGSREDF